MLKLAKAVTRWSGKAIATDGLNHAVYAVAAAAAAYNETRKTA